MSATYTDINFSGLESMLSYTGYSWDVTLELYYAQARMYDASSRRFTTSDPVHDGTNWYAYCANNPLTNTDPMGLWTIALGLDVSAAFLIRFGLTGQIVFDDDGNIGLVGTVSIGGGTPNAAVAAAITVTTANTIFDLEGMGFSLGGSIAIVGIDVVIGTARDGTTVMGATITLGVSLLPAEGHGDITFSGVVDLNWLKPIIGKTVKFMADDYFDNLTCEQIKYLEDIGITI